MLSPPIRTCRKVRVLVPTPPQNVFDCKHVASAVGDRTPPGLVHCALELSEFLSMRPAEWGTEASLAQSGTQT
eukprot:15155303-Alexandrium_andersonii.AAC.1